MNTTATKEKPLREQGPEEQQQDSSHSTAIAFVKNIHASVDAAGTSPWTSISKLLGSVKIGTKDGDAWLPVDIDEGPRNSERVRSVSALVLDIEEVSKGSGILPPSVDDMLAELRRFGHLAILHTSYSHTPEAPRYRIVFALSRPLEKAELRPMGLHVVALLGLIDCTDTKCLEPARLYYLPRCQTEERRAQFRHADIDGALLPVDDLLTEVEAINTATKEAKHERQERKKADPHECSIIDTFNAQADIGQILEQHGYQQHGRNRWISPNSSSGMAGVNLLPESNPPMIFSHHGENDPLADDKPHDAFDCWRILNHGGEWKAAIKEAVRLLGMDGDSRPQEAPRRELPQSTRVDAAQIDGGGMARLWWMPDPVADTLQDRTYRTMTLAQRGLYDMIRREYWFDCCRGLPADPDKLARLLGLSAEEVRTELPAVMPMFDLIDGEIGSKKILAEFSKQQHASKRKSQGAYMTHAKRNAKHDA